MANYRNKKKGGKKESFIFEHQSQKHSGEDPNFQLKITRGFSDCLTRQVSEAVSIGRSTFDEVLNSKSEWHQPALFQVRHEIRRS